MSLQCTLLHLAFSDNIGTLRENVNNSYKGQQQKIFHPGPYHMYLLFRYRIH